MKITGVVYNKYKKAEPFSKVFISDYKGIITPKKIGVITDDNGKFELDITDKDDIYLTAKTSLGEQTISKIKDDVSEYVLYLDVDRSQNIKEVVVTSKKTSEKTKPNVNVDTSKLKRRITIGLLVLGAIILVGGTIYIVKKQSN